MSRASASLTAVVQENILLIWQVHRKPLDFIKSSLRGVSSNDYNPTMVFEMFVPVGFQANSTIFPPPMKSQPFDADVAFGEHENVPRKLALAVHGRR